jgi:hypothetical protein
MSTPVYGNFTLSSNTNDTFLSTTVDDLLVYPDSNSQRMHIGVNKGVGAAMCVTSNGVGVGGQSNPHYPLDILGTAHVSGATYTANGSFTLAGVSCNNFIYALPNVIQGGVVTLTYGSNYYSSFMFYSPSMPNGPTFNLLGNGPGGTIGTFTGAQPGSNMYTYTNSSALNGVLVNWAYTRFI